MAFLKLRRLLMVCLAASLSVPASHAATEPDRLAENVIEAGFLYNFAKFVEWPPTAFAGATAPIVLGIVGINPFGALLTDAAAGKTVNGRAVLVKQFRDDEDFSTCQILFVGSSEKKRTAQILEKLKGASVLSVGEGDGFIRAGGMVAFVVEGDKVRLVINLKPALAVRVKISARVIAVAHLVGGPAQGQN